MDAEIEYESFLHLGFNKRSSWMVEELLSSESYSVFLSSLEIKKNVIPHNPVNVILNLNHYSLFYGRMDLTSVLY